MSTGVDRDLASHLDALRKEHGDRVKIEDVGEIVRSLLQSSGSGGLPAGDPKLYAEIRELATYIHNAKMEIAALRPQDIQSEYIASATDELDAIVGATENATNAILDAAEKIEALGDDVGSEIGPRLSEQTTAIFEACNFQDITGQRITKVVRALKHIEERIDALVAAFGSEVEDAAPPPEKMPEGMTDEDLLNGPQLPDQAHDQASIDALFDKL